jgi:hypothetical protein
MAHWCSAVFVLAAALHIGQLSPSSAFTALPASMPLREPSKACISEVHPGLFLDSDVEFLRGRNFNVFRLTEIQDAVWQNSRVKN